MNFYCAAIESTLTNGISVARWLSNIRQKISLQQVVKAALKITNLPLPSLANSHHHRLATRFNKTSVITNNICLSSYH